MPLNTSATLPIPGAGRTSIKVAMYDKDNRMLAGGNMGIAVYSQGDVVQTNARFVKILEAVRSDVQRQGEKIEPLPEDKCKHYLQELSEIGSEAHSMLPEEVSTYITSMDADMGQHNIGLDFTLAPEMAFLWEMVYPGKPGSGDYKEFWGLRYPIGHLYWKISERPRIRLREGIFASAHMELLYSNKELERLELLLKEVQESLNLRFTVQRLERVTFQEPLDAANLLAYFHDEEFDYGVVHFACHCTNPKDAEGVDAHLILTVQQQAIEVAKGRFLARKRYGFRKLPLVFLNACESATPLHMLQAFDFPRILLDFGAGGVIATVCTIPDNFASAFADEFYRRLIKKALINAPANIGEALLETRLHFLEQYNNPLGLAYGLYAVSNQQLLLSG